MAEQYDWTNGPGKTYVDRFDFAVMQGLMHVHVRSSGESKIFVMDMSLAKKLAKGFSRVVEKIEKENNVTFDDRLDNEPMKSPIQTTVDKEEGDEGNAAR